MDEGRMNSRRVFLDIFHSLLMHIHMLLMNIREPPMDIRLLIGTIEFSIGAEIRAINLQFMFNGRR